MNISNYMLAVPKIRYFIALADFGPKIGIGPLMCSGNPEATWADLIDDVRNHLSKDGHIIHIRVVDGTDMIDVTQEVVEAAASSLLQAAE